MFIFFVFLFRFCGESAQQILNSGVWPPVILQFISGLVVRSVSIITVVFKAVVFISAAPEVVNVQELWKVPVGTKAVIKNEWCCFHTHSAQSNTDTERLRVVSTSCCSLHRLWSLTDVSMQTGPHAGDRTHRKLFIIFFILDFTASCSPKPRPFP